MQATNIIITGDHIDITLNNSVERGDTLNTQYIPGTNKVQDLSGNEAAAFNLPVTIELWPNGSCTDLLLTVIDSKSIQLDWINGSTDETGISIERSLDNFVTGGEIIEIAAGLETYTNTGLDASTLYYYRVRAVKNGYYSDYTDVVSATTEALTVPVLVDPILIENSVPTKIKLTYDQILDETSIPALTAYALSSGRTVIYVEVSGLSVYLTVSSRYYSGDIETVAYTKPGTGMIKDVEGGEAVSFTATAITNNCKVKYTTAEIQAKIIAGYIPVANAADLHFIMTTYSGASTRNFAVGTEFETGEINTTGSSGMYIQVADIDLTHATMVALYGGDWYSSTLGWPALGGLGTEFLGTYDGGTYIISNMYMRFTLSSQTARGLFARTIGGEIKNVVMTGVDIAHTYNTLVYIGALVGTVKDTILRNISVSGNVLCAGSYVGGIVGNTVKVAVSVDWEKLYFNGTITGNDRIGGIVGNLANYVARITNAYTYGSITGDDSVGGLIGYCQYATSETFIKDCYAAMVVTANTNKGGAIGTFSFSTIINVYYDSTVSGQSDTGKGVPKTTTELKTPIAPSAAVYDKWSDYVWNFGTSSDYPIWHPLDCMGLQNSWTDVWVKDAANPLITPIGGEIYPIGTIYYGGYYYIIGKMNDTVIGMYKSADGITGWAYVKAILGASNIPVGWKTFGKYEYNTFFLKDGIFYVIFGVVFSDVTSGVGVASCATVEGTYVVAPTMVIDPDSNDTLAQVGIDFNYITAPELLRSGDTFYWYANCSKDGTHYLLLFTSPSSDWLTLTTKSILMVGSDGTFLLKKEGQVLQAPRVYYYGGYYYLTLTIGGDDNVKYQRDIYIFRSTNLIGWDITQLQLTPIVTADDGVAVWNELRVYCHDILKDNDGYNATPTLIGGKIYMYFSGHSIVGGHDPTYTGVPGLATLTV